MSFKNKSERKSNYDTDKVRVRNSYYTFSKEYPSKNILHRRKAVRKRIKRNRIIKALTLFVCFCVISFSSFFVCNLLLKFSYKPYDGYTFVKSDESSELNINSGAVRAWYLPTDKLSDTDYIESFLSYIKRKDATAVLLDFKDENGKLCFSSSNEKAILSNASLYDNETVRTAISLIKQQGFFIIAKIHCFKDSTVTKFNSDFAIKYLDSDVTWLDNDGCSWLNPFSKGARKYVLDLIDEAEEFSVDAFILCDVSFPYDGATDTLGFGESSKNKDKNNVLKAFISSVKENLGENKLLLISLSAEDVLAENSLKYDGSICDSAADMICVNISKSVENLESDKKNKYVSLLSLVSKIENAKPNEKDVLCVIDANDYTSSLERTLEKNGYKNYIVMSDDGETY